MYNYYKLINISNLYKTKHKTFVPNSYSILATFITEEITQVDLDKLRFDAFTDQMDLLPVLNTFVSS